MHIYTCVPRRTDLIGRGHATSVVLGLRGGSPPWQLGASGAATQLPSFGFSRGASHSYVRAPA